MDRTDERRRRRPPQGSRRPPQRREEERRPGSGGTRRPRPEEMNRSRPASQARQRAPEDRRRERPESRGYAPPRPRPEQVPRRRTYEEYEAPRPRSRAQAERRRREQERLRRQRLRRRKALRMLMLVLSAMVAVFCLYGPAVERPDRPELSHAAQPTEPTTEPPTEPPTKPPIEVTPISSLEDLATLEVPDYVDVQIIDVDGSSRRGVKLEEINDIVLHYVGNTDTTAQQNRDWYADIYSDVSSHFVVGLNGEIIQAVPLDEKSSASNHRNRDTISIEVCHPDNTGKFSDATYESVVEIAAWLIKACDLEVENFIRHYEVTGKVCPKYYVENEDAWQQMLADIRARVEQ